MSRLIYICRCFMRYQKISWVVSVTRLLIFSTLKFSILLYLGPFSRKPDFIACRQQGIEQSAHMLILISAFVILSLKSIKDRLASCLNVLASLCN